MRRILTAVGVFALAVTACASEGEEAPAAATAEGGFPVVIEGIAGDITVENRPERIVSLSPTATEMLFAIGADAQVVAVDEFSNYPAEAPVTALSGFQPNLEAIAELNPDLVVVQQGPEDLVDGLEAIGVPTIQLPAAVALDDSYRQLEDLGLATGNIAGAAEVVAEMQAGVADFVEEYSGLADGVTFYHELDDTLYTATSSTFIGQLYSLLGMVNVADSADDGTGFPQLSAEFLLEQDPQLIFLADTKCCAQDASTIAERPGWGSLSAVQRAGVVELDDDVASRWGPRVLDFYAAVVEGLDALEQAA